MGAFAEKSIRECLKSLRLLELGKLRETLLVSTPAQSAKGKEVAKKLLAVNNEIKNLELDFNFIEARDNENKTRTIYRLINIIGEQVVKFKLLEMYDEILDSDSNRSTKAKREIYEIMEKNNIKLEDL